jgi:hypothetical protein
MVNNGYDNINIKDIIINALELYDKKTIKYYEYINNKVEFINNKIIFYSNDDEKLETLFDLCGYYDIVNCIWIWGWLLPISNTQSSLSRELLNYGLSLDIYSSNNEQIFIKNLLLNSRYIVNDQVGMDINLAIFSFILNEKILFIYPHKNDNIIKYYLIIET